MFKLNIVRLPWRGAEVKARLETSASEAARIAAEYVADQARLYCPVDSGDLKRSIKAIPSQARMRWRVVAMMPYAIHVEYGTTHHTSGGSYFIPPNPFMRRAFADGRKKFPSILKDALVKGNKVTGSVGGSFQAK